MKTFLINIEGLVQGVGFRPFVYKLASSMGLRGSVENLNTGVRIIVNSDTNIFENFIARLENQAPRQSRIDSINVENISPVTFNDFSIVSSSSISNAVTSISPDIAVCDECLADMSYQRHRLNYPLINCTNCGPRFSIIKEVPYDRAMTTMSDFPICDSCRKEYGDVFDRRFHAQPVACNECGPVYSMLYDGRTIKGIDEIIRQTAAIIDKAGIVALKGTGGYHLVCDAMNDAAVAMLRKKKEREGKPFAVMCRDIEAAREICKISVAGEEALKSWERPVVILDGKGVLSQSVSNGLESLGVILPYMPFHYLLFGAMKTSVIIFTSANLSEEPVIIDDADAISGLKEIADAIVRYNRDIYNRTDDSVATVIAGELRLMRRSRGYAPSPVRLKIDAEGVFGAGAELTNCFAIGKGKNLILSQHIGDLKNSATLEFYKEAITIFSSMFRFIPVIVARDLHPDYLSSVFASEMAAKYDVPVVEVQHHHAHIASCMAENGVSERVIGVAMDGVGLGSDGKIWGGEFLLADLCDYERVLHFDYIPIAGGDAVSSEPWRSGVAMWVNYGGALSDLVGLPIYRSIGKEKLEIYEQLLGKAINTSSYSSAGRLFDAVAALTGINLVSTFHAEAPMRLEASIMPGISTRYGYQIIDGVISFAETVKEIVRDYGKGKTPGEISARFHNTIADAIVEGVKQIAMQSDINRVALSGGTFQNRYLTQKVISHLMEEKFVVYFHQKVPTNDGGLALGQVAIAAARREKGLINY